MAECSKSELLASACDNGFVGLTPELVKAIELQLLCNLSSGAGPIQSGPQLYTGSGSPEGVQTAVVGSIYNEITAGVYIAQWIKVSGSGNTGWS